MSQKQTTIEMLFRRHHAKMCRLARTILHDDEESKDAVSDVFAHLMQLKLWPADTKMENYLLSAVRYQCMNIVSRQQLRKKVERLIKTDAMMLPSETNEEQRYSDLLRFIDTELSDSTRRVFLLRFGEHLKYQEIAARLDISEKTVYKHLHQAIILLHEHFKAQEQ